MTFTYLNQHNIGCLQCYIGAASDGYTNISLCKGRRIVDSITNKRNLGLAVRGRLNGLAGRVRDTQSSVPAFLQLHHFLQLVRRQDLGKDVLNPNLKVMHTSKSSDQIHQVVFENKKRATAWTGFPLRDNWSSTGSTPSTAGYSTDNVDWTWTRYWCFQNTGKVH